MQMKLDSEFPFGLDAYLLNQEEITEMGLKIISQIESKDICDNSDALKNLFGKIDLECKGRHLWVLLGSKDSESWLPLQLASIWAEKKDVRYEIKSDFKRMIPFNSKTRVWSSKYHGKIMEVEVGRDVYYQKYAKLREKTKYLAVAILSNEKELKQPNNTKISKYQLKEIELAEELKPLIWNPSPAEKKYYKECKEKSNV